MNIRMRIIKKQLQDFARDARPNMEWHEPDNQGISAEVIGNHLDNAFGNSETGLEYQEFVVKLKVNGSEKLAVNLADLLAIASS